MTKVEINGVVINPDVDEDGLVHLFEFKNGSLIDPSIPIPPEDAYKDLKYNSIYFVNFYNKENVYYIKDIFSIELSIEDCSVLDLMDCGVFNDFVCNAIKEFDLGSCDEQYKLW